MKKFVTSLATFCAASMYADVDTNMMLDKQEPKEIADTSNSVLFEKHESSEIQAPQEITPSARGTDKKVSYVVGADFLYWAFSQDQMNFAFTNQVTDAATQNVDHTAEQIKMMWGPGFKAFMGVNLPYDGWDLIASWSRVQQKKTYNLSGDYFPLSYTSQYSNLSGSTYNTDPYTTGQVQQYWNVSFSLADLLLSRPYLISKHLELRPKAGLAYLHVYQNLKNTYTSNASEVYEKDSIQGTYNGIGPKIALASRYCFAKDIGFVNELNFAALYAQQSSKSTITGSFLDETPPYPINNFSNYSALFRPLMQIESGFDIGKKFDNGCYARLEAKYTMTYLWSQLVHSSPFANYKADMIIQGATAGLFVEF